MATLTFLGAAGEVTGSAYLINHLKSQVLVDFGAFQGAHSDLARNRVPTQINVRKLNAILITHAHLDHVGRLPLLLKRGYHGPIYATPATADLISLILHDAAKVQAEDLERANRKRRRAGLPLLMPTFDDRDVAKVLRLIHKLPYHQSTAVAPGVRVRAFEAGHILGSVSFQVLLETSEKTTSLIFSGDLGPRGMPILRDPEALPPADLVVLESTYGDRDHRSFAATIQEFGQIVATAVQQGGKLLVPAFAVGRTQQLLYSVAELFHDQIVPAFPVYLDSPMGSKATEIYVRHPELSDQEARERHERGQLHRDLDTLNVCETTQESQQLNQLDGPLMIVAGSGMANAGRIVHHLKHNLWRDDVWVLIVGYQAAGTLGRQLVDGAKSVSIHGERIAVRAKIATLGGFSAHAGQTELLEWLAPVLQPTTRVVLTHGEDQARQTLAAQIALRYAVQPHLPQYGEQITL